jgi:hypothetical protein
VAIFSRSKAARVPSFHVPRLHFPATDRLRQPLSSATAALARAGNGVSRVGALALSPSWWWAEIRSATGVAVLLALSVVSLIVGLALTWPHR